MEINTKPLVIKAAVETIWYFILIVSLPIFFIYVIQGEFSILLSLLLLVIFLLFLSVMTISVGSVRNTSYKINDEFISKRKLFISETQDDIPVSQITNVDYKVSWFFDRIFGTGSVVIYTAGTGGAELYMSNLVDYKKVYDSISELVDSQKDVLAKKNKDTSYVKKESVLKLTVEPQAGLATFISLLTTLPVALYFLFMFSGFGEDINMLYILGIFIFLAIFGFVMYGNYKKTRYDFYSDKLVFYRGFLSLDKSTVPYERVTNVSLVNPLLLRIFGLSMIQVETSGSVTANININYVVDGENMVKDLKEVLNEHGRN